jgi:hypothetical protein
VAPPPAAPARLTLLYRPGMNSRSWWVACVLGLVVIGAGCGSKKAADDCQRFVDKSAPMLRKLGKDAGKEIDDKMLGDIVAKCRAQDAGKDKAMMECVLAAANEDAIEACWSEGFKDYADSARKPDPGGPGRASTSEAQLNLSRLTKNAKVAHVQNATFPVGSAPLTPECCGQPGAMCKADPAVWSGLWQDLEFSIEEDHRFRYSYDGTAESFTARAIGDLDCDGATVEITATGSVKDGAPIVTISDPVGND